MEEDRRLGWKSLLQWSTLTLVVVLLLGMFLVIEDFIPPLIFFSVLFLVGIAVIRASARPGAIMLAILLALFLLSDLGRMVEALALPESAADFILTGAILVPAVLSLIAAVALIRKPEAIEEGPGTALAMGGVVVLGAFVVVGVIGRMSLDEAQAQPQDIKLIAENTEFSTDILNPETSTVSVFLDNKDLTMHTFTVESLDVDLEVPGGSSGRITFKGETGRSYEFVCRPHEDSMSGTINFP